MPRVTLYIRQTSGDRTPVKAKAPTPSNPRPQSGVFYLRYEQEGRRVWEAVGTEYGPAQAALCLKQAALWRQEKVEAKPSPVKPKTLEELRGEFIHDKRTTYKKDGSPLDPDTITHYEQVTAEFLKTTGRVFPRDITRQDLKNWMAAQRLRVSHRTVCNLYASVAAFLLFCGVDHKKLIPQNERPTPQDPTPEAYTQEEMTKFFAAVKGDRDALAFEFLLKTGAREREMTFLEWSDLSLGSNPTVKFQTKEGFRTKTGASRTVPLEQTLALKLAAWRMMRTTTRLVFGTGNDKPDTHFLEVCKRTAEKAGMDRTAFWLHKFRDTFATWSLRRGVDIRTVQHWLGHTSIEMTQRYLAPEQGEHAQRQINQAFASKLAEGATA